MLLLHLPLMHLHPCLFVLQGCFILYINPLKKGLSSITKMGEIESAWSIPCMVLVINDNLYGLIFELSFLCVGCPLACVKIMCWSRPSLLVSIGWSQGQGRRSFVDQGQACLHVLESRCVAWSPFVGVKLKGRRRRFGLIKALCGLINSQVQVKIFRRVLSPSWCMGERHENLHQARRNQERWFVLRSWRSSSSTSSGLMRKAKVWSW